jgi:hypothetical protein
MKAIRIELGIAALCVVGLTACTVPAPIPALVPPSDGPWFAVGADGSKAAGGRHINCPRSTR